MADFSRVPAPGELPADSVAGARSARFGVFELDLRSGELRRDGVRVKLQEQPFRVLAFLLERAGDVVTREELREHLWPQEFVDFDHSLNTAVRKLRAALDDSADTPRFIETLARRGYRFIAPVAWRSPAELPALRRRRRSTFLFAGTAAIIALLIAVAAVLFRDRGDPGAQAKIDSIAVLPFGNAGRGDEHVSDGLTEIVIDTLSRIPDLRVMARTTVFEYKGKTIDPRRAGRELSVDAVVAGEIRAAGDGYTIRIELIDVRDGTQLSGIRYHAARGELPAAQNRICEDLSLRLRDGVPRRQSRVYTRNAEAYDFYLRGLYLFNTRDWSQPGRVRGAADHFTRATQLDPAFAAAYAGLAGAYGVMTGTGLIPPDEGALKVLAAARKALELDPFSAEAYTTLATTKFTTLWDFPGAGQDYRRALELNPSYVNLHVWYANYLRSMGQWAEARRENELAYKLDPFSPLTNHPMCMSFVVERRFREAVAFSRRAASIKPDLRSASCEATAFFASGDFESALALLRETAPTPETRAEVEALAGAYRRSGRRGFFEQRIENLKALPAPAFNTPFELAEAYALLGDRDQAFAWLEKAYEHRLSPMAGFHINLAFEGLRDDPRFDELRRRIGLPDVDYDAIRLTLRFGAAMLRRPSSTAAAQLAAIRADGTLASSSSSLPTITGMSTRDKKSASIGDVPMPMVVSHPSSSLTRRNASP